jgi:hypothetical protein
MALYANEMQPINEVIERLMSKAQPHPLSDTGQDSESQSRTGSNNQINGAKPRNCSRCFGTGFVVSPKGARPCLCKQLRVARARLAQIPPRFGKPKLSRLSPLTARHPQQSEIIAAIKARPDQSYLFCGANGTGKTHFAWALFRHAIASGRRVVGCSVRELLEDYRQAAINSNPESFIESFKPRVLPEDLKVQGQRWTLLLDEFEKARPSEFAAEMLFALLDAAHSFEHQLIVTSNFAVDKLIAHWGRLDDVWGRSIVRRLEHCVIIEMY